MAVHSSAERSTGDLLVGASTGDTTAVEELYRRHKPAGVGYARRRGAEDPEAIYDHVFVDVLAKADYLSTERPNGFVAYLNRSIKNRIIQESRRKRPAITLEGDRADALATEPGFEDLVVGTSWVDEAFSELTDAQREVMKGRYIEQRTLADVAERLGKSPASVRQLHRAALTRLRTLLAIGVALLAVAAAAWIVRELATTSVDTSPIERIDRDDTSTGPPGPGDEQGMAPLASIGRLTDDHSSEPNPDRALPFVGPEPTEDGPVDTTGPPTTAEPDGGATPSSIETVTLTPTPTPTSRGTGATGAPTTESTPGDSSQVPTSSTAPTAPTTSAPDDDNPPASTTTAVMATPTPATILSTTAPAPPAAPPSSGLIAYDPFTRRNFSTFGFDPDSVWTVAEGQIGMKQNGAGLSYTDRRGQRLVDEPGALQVSYLSDSAELRRLLPAVPSGEYGYAVSFLLRVDTATTGEAFWTPNGGPGGGAAGLQSTSQSVGFIDGPLGTGTVEEGETVLVAVQIVGDVANLWVNPRLDRPGTPGASHQVVATDPTHAVFGFGGGRPAGFTIDEFRIGSTLADVLPYTSR